MLQVFEHDQLRIDGRYRLDTNDEFTFEARHHAALARFAARQERAFFLIRHRSVLFRQYVGTIQIGDLTIDVLPKADRHAPGDPRWRAALLGMLRIADFVPNLTIEPSASATATMSLLDIYCACLLDELDALIRGGLVRRYRTSEGNGATWRGRLIVSQHLRHNIGRPDRVYCEHIEYDHAHWIHAILREAMRTIAATGGPGEQRVRARAVLHQLPDAPPFAAASMREFPQFDRATARYETALRLARLLLEGRSPDVCTGEEPVLALMVDMNRLFERFVATTVRKAMSDCRVAAQRSIRFWPDSGPSARRLVADLVVEDLQAERRVVLDTKWKDLADGWPGEADLRQAFAYGHMFSAAAVILLFPRGAAGSERSGEFCDGSGRCEVRYLDVFDESGRFAPDEVQRRLVAMIRLALSTPGR